MQGRRPAADALAGRNAPHATPAASSRSSLPRISSATRRPPALSRLLQDLSSQLYRAEHYWKLMLTVAVMIWPAITLMGAPAKLLLLVKEAMFRKVKGTYQ